MRNTTIICLLLGTTLVASFGAEARNRSHYKDDNAHGSYQAFGGYVSATGNKTIIVDPNTHAWAAYEGDGQLVRWGRASLGKNYCPDIRRGCRTITGTFTIFSKKGAGCISSRFPVETHGGARMPFCMHFYKGYAIHGSNDVPNANASHGCVRVPVSDARWLNQEFAEYGTRVIIRPYNNAPSKHRYSYYDENWQQNTNYYQENDQPNYQPNYQQVSDSDRNSNQNSNQYSTRDGYYDENSQTVYVYSDNYVDGSIF